MKLLHAVGERARLAFISPEKRGRNARPNWRRALCSECKSHGSFVNPEPAAAAAVATGQSRWGHFNRRSFTRCAALSLAFPPSFAPAFSRASCPTAPFPTRSFLPRFLERELRLSPSLTRFSAGVNQLSRQSTICWYPPLSHLAVLLARSFCVSRDEHAHSRASGQPISVIDICANLYARARADPMGDSPFLYVDLYICLYRSSFAVILDVKWFCRSYCGIREFIFFLSVF